MTDQSLSGAAPRLRCQVDHFLDTSLCNLSERLPRGMAVILNNSHDLQKLFPGQIIALCFLSDIASLKSATETKTPVIFKDQI